jgi:predicted Fe-Mo cluster-binding NifX family protein
MKIVIPVEDKTVESLVSGSFGRAPYFLFYDTDSKETNFSVNEAADNQGGAGIKAAQIIVDAGAGVLLAPRCGENAAVVLQKAKIQIYQSVPGPVRINLQEFENGTLKPLSDIHPGFHGHQGG